MLASALPFQHGYATKGVYIADFDECELSRALISMLMMLLPLLHVYVKMLYVLHEHALASLIIVPVVRQVHD